MSDQLEERLMQARARVRADEKIAAVLAVARDSLASRQAERDRLSAVLDREQADVDRLEGLSLAALFYSMLGN